MAATGVVQAAGARWVDAAQALVSGVVDLPSDDDRVALLAAICKGLGDELYPAFLRLLGTVGRLGDHAACAAIADTLVHALRTGRLPSGRRSAFGAPASTAPAAGAFGSTRSLGPIEYLCAWHAQGEPGWALAAADFDEYACTTMQLVDAGRDARTLYCDKLLADVDDPLGPLGAALTRATRHALRELATAWAEGLSAEEAVARFKAALPGAQGRGFGLLGPAGVLGRPGL